MPGIFDDERRGSGPIAPDPRGTGLIPAKRIDNSVPDPYCKTPFEWTYFGMIS